MMQIGIRLHDMPGNTFQERVDAAANAHFECVHLALSKAVQEYPYGKEALTPGYASFLRKTFEKAGMDISIFGCYQNLANPNPEKLKNMQEMYIRSLMFSKWLGATVVGTETGSVTEDYKPGPYDLTDEALDRFIEGLFPVVEAAEKIGGIIAIEPVCYHIVSSPKRARKVLDTIHSPNLKIIYDQVNMVDAENYTRIDSLIDEYTELLGDEIACVHIKDYVIRDGKRVSVPTGRGIMPETSYKKIIRYLRDHKPFSYVSFESSNLEDSIYGRDLLRRLEQEIN